MLTNFKKRLVDKSGWVIIACHDNRVVSWHDDPDDMQKFLKTLRIQHPHNTYKVATLC